MSARIRLSSAVFRNRAHFKRESDRIYGRSIGRGGDDRGAGETSPISVGRERHNENGLENAVEHVALPDDDGPAPSLFLRTVGAKVRPPKFATPQPRSSRSSAAAQSSRPAPARSASSA